MHAVSARLGRGLRNDYRSRRYPYAPGGTNGVLDAAGPWRLTLPRARPEREILDYCSREMGPPVGGASRNRETMFERHVVPLARFVKQISIFCQAEQAGYESRNMP